MAKGDHSRMQNQVNQQTGLAQNNLNNLRTDVTGNMQNFQNRYNVAADQASSDYSNLMNRGNDYYGSVMNEPLQNFESRGGYENFANTGGFSDSDLQNMRARSVAPMRAVYANANADVDRQRSLQGGYAPNAIAARAKMARELSYNLGDMASNVEAGIADQIRQGKLAGLSGLTNIDNALLNARTARMGLGGDALKGMAALYGEAPGAAQMYGNELGNSMNSRVNIENLQNDVMKNALTGQNMVSNTAGNTASVLGNVAQAANIAGTIAGMANPGVAAAQSLTKGVGGKSRPSYEPNDTNGWG